MAIDVALSGNLPRDSRFDSIALNEPGHDRNCSILRKSRDHRSNLVDLGGHRSTPSEQDVQFVFLRRLGLHAKPNSRPRFQTDHGLVNSGKGEKGMQGLSGRNRREDQGDGELSPFKVKRLINGSVKVVSGWTLAGRRFFGHTTRFQIGFHACD